MTKWIRNKGTLINVDNLFVIDMIGKKVKGWTESMKMEDNITIFESEDKEKIIAVFENVVDFVSKEDEFHNVLDLISWL